MQGDLLETLSQKTGVFISNLRNRALLPEVLVQLRGMTYEKYSLEQWTYCIHYLLGNESPFESYDELGSFLDTLFSQIDTKKDAQ